MDNSVWMTIYNLQDIIARRWGKKTIDRFGSGKNRESKYCKYPSDVLVYIVIYCMFKIT